MKEYAVFNKECCYGCITVFVPVNKLAVFESFSNDEDCSDTYFFWKVFSFDEEFINALSNFSDVKCINDEVFDSVGWKVLGYEE